MSEIRQTLDTLDDVRHWLRGVIQFLGLGFHPDTPFDEYINLKECTPSYSAEDAFRLTQELDLAFAVCDREGADLYAIAIEIDEELGLLPSDPIPDRRGKHA